MILELEICLSLFVRMKMITLVVKIIFLLSRRLPDQNDLFPVFQMYSFSINRGKTNIKTIWHPDNLGPRQFGTISLKTDNLHPDNLAPENLARFTEVVLPTI